MTYFLTSRTSLFNRSYGAVGFWGHLQDVAVDLWHRIPSILNASRDGNDAALHAALDGVSTDDFFDTWGSSAFNNPAGGDAWTARSPLPDSGFTAPSRTISRNTSDTIAPDSTDQLTIAPPTPPAGDVETVHIDPGLGYARFGLAPPNYTGATLAKLTFCGGTSCPTSAGPPAPGSCGGGETYTPPPTLTPLPARPLLGLAAASSHAVVTIDFTTVPLTAITTGTCTPTPPPPSRGTGSGTGSASSFGDPHLVDFTGGVYDFQQAGEFTLLQSTTDDFQVQIRQQPDGNCCVSFNTAVAVRVGSDTVEVVPNGPDGLVVYENKHRTSARTLTLGTAGSLQVTTESGVPLVKVALADGSTVGVYNTFGALGLDVALTAERYDHVTGLLGHWGGSAATQFVGRTGKPYSASVITGTSTQDVHTRYDEFGASWRMTQKQSLFMYGKGQSTSSFLVKGFPHKPLTIGQLNKALRALAEKLCHAAGITKTALLDACALDVGATGQHAFATGDARVQRGIGPTAPGWIHLSTSSTTVPTFAPAVAEQAGSVLVAYPTDANKGIEVARFAPTPGAPGTIARTDPITNWASLGGVFLLPGASGTDELVVSGNHSSTSSDPLNGLDALQPQSGGTYSAPASVGATPASADTSSVIRAHDGTTLLWTPGALLGVDNGSTNPPTGENLTYPSGATLEFTTDATLATDTSGRLWLVWDGSSGAGQPSGIYLLQLDPETGASLPGAIPQLAPDSSNVVNASHLTLACNAACHVIYQPTGTTAKLVSWAPGQSAPVTVVQDTASKADVIGLAAAAASNGQLWVVYESAVAADASSRAPHAVANIQIDTELGDDNGAGGTVTVSPAAVAGAVAFHGKALPTADGLLVTADWLTSTTTGTGGVYATVIPPG
jgi:hypothetical protein